MPVRQLSKELQEKAINELNEVPTRLEEDLTHLKKWLQKQPHINARTDDQWLSSFLRGCKFSLERAKEKLDIYYTVKSMSLEFFGNRDPLSKEIQEVLDIGFILPLPKLPDPASPRFFLVRCGHFDPAKIDQAKQFKITVMIQNILLMEDDNFVVSGANVIVDMDNTGIPTLLSLTPTLMKKVMVYVQQAYPNRIKSLSFIKISQIFETFINVFRPLLSEKLKKRMQVFSNKNLEELYKICPKSILPEEYGGEGGKLDDITAYWKAKVESYRQWFLDDDQYKTDEKKRVGKPKTTDSIFGIDGSFRQLTVD